MAAAVDSQPAFPGKTEVSPSNDVHPATHSSASQELWDVIPNGRAPEQYTGQGEDDLPRTPVRKIVKKSSTSHINGHARSQEGSISQLMVEKFQDKDGEHLTAIKQSRQNGRSQHERSDELLSGRKVGTKWEKSQYDDERSHCMSVLTVAIQHPFCPSISTASTATADARCAGPYTLHRPFPDGLLSSRRDSLDLAITPTIPALRSFQQRWREWKPLPSLESPPLIARLVPVRLLLSRPTPPLCSSGTHTKIHIWISPTRDYFSWSIRFFRY